jgi:hypothetical protein
MLGFCVNAIVHRIVTQKMDDIAYPIIISVLCIMLIFIDFKIKPKG